MFDVVMPLFNKEKFVGAAIQSVLAQGFDQWRLFIVDDGSTDGGAEVVHGYGDPRITLIEQANQGVGPARNAGGSLPRVLLRQFHETDFAPSV